MLKMNPCLALACPYYVFKQFFFNATEQITLKSTCSLSTPPTESIDCHLCWIVVVPSKAHRSANVLLNGGAFNLLYITVTIQLLYLSFYNVEDRPATLHSPGRNYFEFSLLDYT